MFQINLFLSHLISDFAFSDVYSKDFLDKKNYYKHMIWAAVVFFIFNFDTNNLGKLFAVLAFLIHVALDFFRIKKGSTLLFETISSLSFLILSIPMNNYYLDSYISNPFQIYILGLLITTSIGSYIFRTFNILPKGKKDTTGTSERLAVFIFIMAHQYILALIAIIAGIIYKMLFEKRKDKEIIYSIIYGTALSFIWMLIMGGLK
ncbi:hypothetical protein OSSY52_12390 [Tepiditoga spiralis]|uniref:DUF3307 domain-containing protein n=1 Tax=Tepiditoga spiralis TaxID=2108365 RepID=A0A7G1G3S3_9BACT|nr:hypothetical protein [Tepiditoga spiralis]BBE31098.1 hypothetical protein OSSY52_12390 [Tepiditoga spiralis]